MTQSYRRGHGFWNGFGEYINNNWASAVVIATVLAFAAYGISMAAQAIARARLANAAKVKTEYSVKNKLKRYLLNPNHPDGASKANWFKKALGFDLSNMNDLAKQIIFSFDDAVPTILTPYGQKYSQMIEIIGANGRIIIVQFNWIYNTDDVVRLIGAIPTPQ